jgi:hypothetical protein
MDSRWLEAARACSLHARVCAVLFCQTPPATGTSCTARLGVLRAACSGRRCALCGVCRRRGSGVWRAVLPAGSGVWRAACALTVRVVRCVCRADCVCCVLTVWAVCAVLQLSLPFQRVQIKKRLTEQIAPQPPADPPVPPTPKPSNIRKPRSPHDWARVTLHRWVISDRRMLQCVPVCRPAKHFAQAAFAGVVLLQRADWETRALRAERHSRF